MLLKGGQSRPPLRNSDYINTNATGLSSSEEGLFLTLVHRIFLNMSLYIHWKHGIICEVSRCGCLCPFARRTMAQYPSQPAGFEEGPKNPLKGTSVKPLVSASYAQSGVDAGGRRNSPADPGRPPMAWRRRTLFLRRPDLVQERTPFVVSDCCTVPG